MSVALIAVAAVVVLVLLLLGGVQLVTLGLLGEMLARTYHESQAKPIYRLREVRTAAVPHPADASTA